MATSTDPTVRSRYKAATRSADDKALLEVGLIDENGDLRKEGRFAVLDYLVATNADVKAHLVNMAKTVIKHENPSKK